MLTVFRQNQFITLAYDRGAFLLFIPNHKYYATYAIRRIPRYNVGTTEMLDNVRVSGWITLRATIYICNMNTLKSKIAPP